MSIHDLHSVQPDPVPVNLPHAVITVTEFGSLDVFLDGVGIEPAVGEHPWTRARFSDLLDVLTQGRGRPVRVEVHEADGTVFTDIIHAIRRPAPVASATPVKAKLQKKRSAPMLVEVTGDGFIPGEDISVAVTITSGEAGMDGHTRAIIDLTDMPEHATGEVLLYGSISGTTAVRRLS